MTTEKECIFCIDDPKKGTEEIAPNRIIEAYDNWWLFLQLEEKRAKTKQAAGLLVAKRHFEIVSMATQEEWTELRDIMKPAAQSLCDSVDAEYAGQETIGFNQGVEAGQTIQHAHVHLLPVSEADPSELKVRGGIGGAFEALREARVPK